MRRSLRVLPAHVAASLREPGRQSLTEGAAKDLVAAFGISVPAHATAATAEDAALAAASLRAPFVVKVVSPDILHKSDVGGVRLGLRDLDAVRRAIMDMAALPGIAGQRVDGWLVEEMSDGGQELVVGAVRDPQFGPMVMVGLGGIFVEVLGDVAFRICPIDAADANDMLASLKGAALIEGARGRAALDRQAIINILLAVGGADGLMMRLPEVAELDLNPILVSERGARAVDARVILGDGGPPRTVTPATGAAALEQFRPLFAPRTVAVLGASTKSATALPNTFMRRLKAFGFDGPIYPIHPEADSIDGVPAYRSLGVTPEPVDYAFVAIGADRIPPAFAAGKGRVRFAQVISSGFAEVEGGDALERALVSAARDARIRVLGPNCLGTYAPRGKLTFSENAPSDGGSIGLISQSGGLTTNMIRRGSLKGLRFSAASSVGNCADVGPAELIAYFLADPETKAIGCYLEDVKDGRAVFELMRSATKPLVLLRGGRSDQGRLAAASHTGALAGDGRGWEALAAQTPCVEVATLDQFLDTLLALQDLTLRPDRPTRRVVMFGNGGGSSVLGADVLADEGLEVAPFAADLRAELEKLDLLPGSSVANPIDTPVATLQQHDGKVARDILRLVYAHGAPDALAMHLNMSSFSGRGGVDPVDGIFTFLTETMAAHPGSAHVLLAFRTDGDPALEERKRQYRDKARAARIPIFDEIPELARALGAVARLERQLAAAKVRTS